MKVNLKIIDIFNLSNGLKTITTEKPTKKISNYDSATLFNKDIPYKKINFYGVVLEHKNLETPPHATFQTQLDIGINSEDIKSDEWYLQFD